MPSTPAGSRCDSIGATRRLAFRAPELKLARRRRTGGCAALPYDKAAHWRDHHQSALNHLVRPHNHNVSEMQSLAAWRAERGVGACAKRCCGVDPNWDI